MPRDARNLLRRLNDLSVFDVAGFPERERIARGFGVVACIAYLGYRLARFPSIFGTPPRFVVPLRAALEGTGPWSAVEVGIEGWDFLLWLVVWLLETGVFAGYLLAFLTRREARSAASGFREVVLPLLVAGLPFVITFSPMGFGTVWPPLVERLARRLDAIDSWEFAHSIARLCRWEAVLVLLVALIVIGGAWNLVALLTLRPGFALMSEARVFVRTGVFSWVRHPIYAGHFVIFFAYLMLHLHWYTCLVYVAFVLGQRMRARIEEAKLESVFPDYAAYRAETGMFWPKWRRVRSKGPTLPA